LINNQLPDNRRDGFGFIARRNTDADADNARFIKNGRPGRRLEEWLCGVLGRVLPRERAVGQFQVVRHRKRFFAMLNGAVGCEIENPVIPPARVNA